MIISHSANRLSRKFYPISILSHFSHVVIFSSESRA